MFHFGINYCFRFQKNPIESSGLFLKSLENFSVVKLHSTCFEKLIFQDVFNVRKTKSIAKFDGLEPWRREGIVAPEIGPKKFGTFAKLAPSPKRTSYNYDNLYTREFHLIAVNLS